MEEYKELKSTRVMELFFRALKGEALSAQALADEYQVSTRSITRDINTLKDFLAEHRDTTGYAELVYSGSNHCYTLQMDSFLSNSELLALCKILIGSRALQTEALLSLIGKLKMNTSPADRKKLDNLIRKEVYQYSEIGFDCKNILDMLWKVTECIENKNIITIDYYKMSRENVKRRIKPISVMFSEYYFYLIAYPCESNTPNTPHYYRIDRITNIIVHRNTYHLTREQNVDEGLLRKRSMYFFPGEMRRIRFEFTGPSVQAVLDKIPTARIVERKKDGSYIIDAEVYGDGIRLFLLSQGSWVKVLAPDDFVEEMKAEIERMAGYYR